MFEPADWRKLMGGSRLDRLRARAGSTLWFPMKMLLDALGASDSVVVPTTNPFFLPALAVATRWLHRSPVVPLVYDLYPDALEVSGVATRGGAIDMIATALNRWWLHRADGVVFIGEGMAEHVCKRYTTPQRWTVIETGAELKEFEHAGEASETDLERWCEGKRVIGYVGNLGHMHDWETLADAIPRVVAMHDRVGVLVVASGAAVAKLRLGWASLPKTAVLFAPPLDDRAWARLLARTDISVSTLRVSAAKTSIPSKTFSAMAAGSAIVAVAPDDSDLAHLVRKHACGDVVEPGDVDGLVATFSRLLTHPEELRTRRANSIAAVHASYDMPELAHRWDTFLSQMPDEKRVERTDAPVKRAIDVMVASGALLLTAPALLAAMGLVRATLGAPVFFRQERPGLDGVPFELIKLRTMRKPAPGADPLAGDAERLTAVGRFLRKTSIDELPTLWNVIRGDMSLVGPRPLLMRYLPRYSAEQRRRHAVKPGITGWAQVNGRNAIGWDQKFLLDLYYVDNRSVWLDLKILAKTLGKVVGSDGIAHGDSATMPEFHGSGQPG
jgi:lipopolysaccharide/colanic/teichoic acid biosynthesis glycosyltransferase